MSNAPTRRVLVVDDDDAVRETLEDLLATLGYLADLVPSGPEALARVERRRYDIVITDLLMPGMTGWTVLDEVRLRYPRLPVVVLTGSLLDATDGRLAQQGVVLVRKPVELRVLDEALSRVLAETW